MSAKPEFSRSVRIDSLGAEPRRIALLADEAERSALARRFGLAAIARLEAEAEVRRSGDVVSAAGTLRASVTQSCVATGDPVEAAVEEPFRIEFHPPPAGRADEEIELEAGEMDVVFHDGTAVDLGEAVAQTLPLALDPYPRGPGADEAMRAAGVKGEAEAKAASHPFAGLAALRDKIGK
jgi:uncharacterized metal-binding protein YceD (DUF177 family)